MRIVLLLSGCFSGEKIEPATAQNNVAKETNSCLSPSADPQLVTKVADVLKQAHAAGQSLRPFYGPGDSFYTLEYVPESSISTIEGPNESTVIVQPSFIKVLESQRGDRNREHLLTYVDFGLDGCVNSGATGLESPQLNLLWMDGPHPDNVGLDQHAIWQVRFNAAIQAAAEHLNVR